MSTRQVSRKLFAGGLCKLVCFSICFGMVCGCQFAGKKPGGLKKQAVRIGACDWTLGKRADPASLELAARLGLDGVQLDCGRPRGEKLALSDGDLQSDFLQAAEKYDVEIASIAIGILNGLPLKSHPNAEAWVRESIDICRVLGCRVVLLPFFGKGDLRNDPAGVAKVVERLRRLAPQAEKAGVVLGLESWLSAEQHLDIIKRVGSPAVKVYYDVGNSHKEGYDIYREIRFLGSERICEFHAKDYDALYGKGSIDFEKVRQAMNDIGYCGWMQIEGVKMPLGVEESIRYDAQYLHSVFGRATCAGSPR